MIHKYYLNGYYIVLDVHSGAVHVVDKIHYDLLDHIQAPMNPTLPQALAESLSQYSKEDLQNAYQELYGLYQAGQLFSPDDYEQYRDMMVSAPIKSMCLHIAHDCNLRCKYCFASTGDFGTGRKIMPLEIGKKAIDFLLVHSQGRHNLEVDFFGGEPLMNFDVVKEVVKYARSKEKEYNKNFRFTIPTNGVLLTDDKIDFINQEMSNVVLSIDGRKEVNDRLRVRVDGSGSYDSIVPKFQKLVAQRSKDKDYYARGTFTKYNMDFAEDVLHMVDDLGFDQLSVEPVVADPYVPYSIHEEDFPTIFKEYERLANIIIDRKKAGKGFNFFHFMLDLEQGPCAIKRLRGCGCGNEYVAITPDGDIYPCHQFVGQEEWKMGSLLDDTLNLEMKDMFAKATIYGKPDCQACWAKFYCSGGCNANNATHCGDIHKSYQLACDLERKRLECAIMIKAALADTEDTQEA